MKILLIDNSLDNTGASKALIKTIAEIDNKDLEFIFLFPKGSKCVKAAADAGFQAHELAFTEISKRPSSLLSYIPALIINTRKAKKIIKSEGVSIVHVNDIYNMLGLSLKLSAGIKVITHVRRMPESFPRPIYNMWSRLHVAYTDHIVAVSEANKKALPENNKTTVIYDPLPEEETQARYQAKPKLNKELIILYLANFTDGKGHLHALKLLEKFVAEYPEWKVTLNLYGGTFGLEKNSLYKEMLFEYARNKHLESFVHFHGPTSQIEAVMKQHDIILNLSDSESFSRVTLEALFFGIPIVATDVGGTKEMVINEETGILVSPMNVDQMYKGFTRLIFDDSLRCRLSKCAFEYVRKQFSKAQTVDKLVAVYKACEYNN